MPPPPLLYRQVLDRLGADIRSGALPVGTALPSEKELGGRFGVSRITIRRAMDELAQEGLIDRGVGRVSRVAAPRLTQAIASFEDPLGMVRLVRNTTARTLSFAWRPAQGRIARALQVEDGETVLQIARLRSREDMPVFHTETFLPHAIGTLIDRTALDRHTMHDVLAAAGCVPASVERQIRAAPCPPAIAKALGLRALAPTFHVERISRDGQGTPLHFLAGHWRWDRFSMRLFSDAAASAGTVRIDEVEQEEEHGFDPVAP